MLTLEIEFLAGVCFAAKSPASDEPDWPPQPDRVFSALVAAWGARGERSDERIALEWLEQQTPPTLEASGFETRHIGISYVPPNDPTGKPEVLPDRRRRQARMFPAAIPYRPLLRMRWDSEPNPVYAGALRALARDTAYLGHSASVVRCQFIVDSPAPVSGLEPTHARRRVYPGRLAELETHYKTDRRPPGGEFANEPSATPDLSVRESVFGSRWIVLEDAGGRSPDLRAAAVVSRRLRDALMSRYGSAALSVPEVVSGHQPDGSPATAPHLAIVPMADVGFKHSEGRLLGMAIILPRAAEEAWRSAERQWAEGLQSSDEAADRWENFDRLLAEVSELKLGGLGVWRLIRELQPRKESLHPGRYIGVSATWASATPIVLDRFPKSKSPAAKEEEIVATIADSCVNIGLPGPSTVRIYKHSAVKGAPSAYPSGSSPAWTEWTLPGNLNKRMLTHVIIEFPEPIRGPLILGAGRFLGMGLCLPYLATAR